MLVLALCLKASLGKSLTELPAKSLPLPLVFDCPPRSSEQSQGLVVEITLFEMEQPFKTLIGHPKSSMVFL